LPHITIEYMIMVPLLILQIFLFPIVAVTIMNTWSNSRMTIELQDVSGHLASSMQQLYYTMNHGSISTGSITARLDVPTFIEDGNYRYNYMIILSDATNPSSSVRVMNLTLSLIGASGKASTLITLGQNADWQNNSTFKSNNISLINATKSSEKIFLSFQGGT
jgi:hypothetical protein